MTRGTIRTSAAGIAALALLVLAAQSGWAQEAAAAEAEDGVKVFHAGTARTADGQLVASGGRTLNVTALGGSVTDAQRRAYAAIDKIDWQGGFFRRDIGWRAIARET